MEDLRIDLSEPLWEDGFVLKSYQAEADVKIGIQKEREQIIRVVIVQTVKVNTLFKVRI